MGTKEAKRDRGNYFYRFHPKKVACQNCVLRPKCYQKTTRYKGFSVKKEYFDNSILRAEMTEKLSSVDGKRRITERSCLVEHVFGEIKAVFKFRRFLHRGIDKVRVIWELVCIGYNFRKLARLAYA